jgi:hypothetical protein
VVQSRKEELPKERSGREARCNLANVLQMTV